MEKKLRCGKCFVTLQRLNEDGLYDYLIKVVKAGGQEDYICPKEVMEWVQDHMSNARLDFIAGCGHLPFLTKTKEYNDLLENFLIN